MNTTVFYAPDAVGSNARYFFDGVDLYERVQGLNGLGDLHGWLKKVTRKLKKGVKKLGKKLKKIGKKAIKFIRKALPIVNTVLSFIPGVGWVAAAALTAVEIGLNAAEKARKRKEKKKLQKQMKLLNSKTTRVAKKATPVKAVNPVSTNTNNITKAVTTTTRPKVVTPSVQKSLTTSDVVKINQAVNANALQPDQVAQLIRLYYQSVIT